MKQEKDREVYNQKTLEAMKEAKKIARDSKYPSYENLDELKRALLDEDHRKKSLIDIWQRGSHCPKRNTILVTSLS